MAWGSCVGLVHRLATGCATVRQSGAQQCRCVGAHDRGGLGGGLGGTSTIQAQQLIILIKQTVGEPKDWAKTTNPFTGLPLDPLSAGFLLLITGGCALIHLSSLGSMGHDPARRRTLR